MDQILRRQGISGSRVAAIFGKDPYLTEFDLWLELKGRAREKTQPEAADDVRKMLGQCLEPGLLDMYGRYAHCKVLPNQRTYRSREHPLVVGTPDGFIEGKPIGVDAKVVAPDQARNWGTEIDAVPYHIALQVYWYMILMGYDSWVIAALVGGWLRFYTIPRLDPEAEAQMLARVKEWWDRYIEGDEQPRYGPSTQASAWIAERYPRPRPEIREATVEEIALLDRYVSLRVAQNEMKRDRLEMENEIKGSIGDIEGITWGEGGRFTWKCSKSGGTDWKEMAVELLASVPEDERAGLKARFARPGSRRIRVTHPRIVEEEVAEVTA